MNTFITRTLFALALLTLTGPALSEPLKGKVGVYSFPDTVWWDQWMGFQSEIEANPDFDFEWYLRGELGSEQQLITGARRNRIQVISISSQGMTSLVPEMGVLLAPYMFDSLEEADFVLDNYLSEPIGQLFGELGLQVVQFTDVGWGVLYSVDRPVLVPADLAGMTLRISPSIILQSFVESVGADYAILEVGELIPGLQTGLVHGGLTNVVFVHNALDGQVCCVTRLKGMYEMGVNFANKEWFDSATDAQKSALVDAYVELPTMRKNVRAYVEQVVLEGEAKGISYLDLSPEQRESWKTASASGLQRILDDTGSEGARLYDLIVQGKAAFARQQINGQ
ncbi:MAG: TRAP transporter substrate-binding protein DctP [Rhodospirillaceae bacterium]|jgi:TRAP-type transport system periplasmic protein|nr:TRAP transporter substrate-binding protein DctP [Rhodospirillaceae bacterium]MBT5240631.1 TRAP transporter substrate-binding protein DctP [Rhodospirillaceae bacterium]MBT5564466.1 TRAP transporter substrate-binding protein DctP [Rhodospirillaceae bacterium]MBT6089756.1 TRAP transporter substrate-binding protein DctP [Rhodospirillaceae bacterium]MBT6960797.1 TRAP transporter substrate-binding protein DctP [Rhodospirillaceae bacterium]